jgi:hypothetical protein
LHVVVHDATIGDSLVVTEPKPRRRRRWNVYALSYQYVLVLSKPLIQEEYLAIEDFKGRNAIAWSVVTD